MSVTQKLISLAVAAAAFLILPTSVSAQSALGTGITYQGRITNGAQPIDGPTDMEFRLCGEPTGGTPINTVAIERVEVVDGLFTVELDFGSAEFDGHALWLEVAINGQPLSPRQPLNAAPYALKVPGVDGSSLHMPGTDQDVLSVTGAGKVTIHETQPLAALHVDGRTENWVGWFEGSHPNGTEMILYSTTGSRTWGLKVGGSAQPGASGKFIIRDASIGADRLAIDTQGRVGIGTTAPANRLSVAGRADFADHVGIGTAAPARPLHVAGLAGIQIGDGVTSGSSAFLVEVSSATDGYAMLNAIKNAGSQWGNVILANHGGNVGIGTTNPQQKLEVNGTARTKILEITGGSDVAEPYDIAAAGDVLPIPGMVVTIDPQQVGRLRVSSRALDRTVAGIISGAGGVNPGLMLTQAGSVADGKLPVASVGRVWCLADAGAAGPIAAGDLLTTSDTPGHAMRVGEADRANGAIIGNAMSSLEKDRGLVLVLVALQ